MSWRNRHAQELHEQTTTHARFSHWRLLSKNTHLMMWAICNSLTRRYSPSNSQNNWLYAAVATKKKTYSKVLLHIINIQSVSDDVSWQVKIGLHQCDNYLSKVKINVRTVNNSHTQDIWRFLRLSAGQCPGTVAHRVQETISFLAWNLAKCWLVLIFHSTLSSEFAINLRWKCHNTSNAYLQWFMIYR